MALSLKTYSLEGERMRKIKYTEITRRKKAKSEIYRREKETERDYTSKQQMKKGK